MGPLVLVWICLGHVRQARWPAPGCNPCSRGKIPLSQHCRLFLFSSCHSRRCALVSSRCAHAGLRYVLPSSRCCSDSFCCSPLPLLLTPLPNNVLYCGVVFLYIIASCLNVGVGFWSGFMLYGSFFVIFVCIAMSNYCPCCVFSRFLWFGNTCYCCICS